MLITEYINIFKLIRTPNLYDLTKFFLTIDETFNTQNNDTNIALDDYIIETENISQEIIITMVFNIENNINLIQADSLKIKKILKIDNSDKETFILIKKEINKW